MIWEIQGITGMSKKEVLEQIYPDELDYIFRKKRDKEIQRYEGYRHTMIAVAAGFGGKTEDDKPLFEVYNQYLDEIIDQLQGNEKPVEEEKKEYTPEDLGNELNKLQGLIGIVEQTKNNKRPPKGVR